MENSTVCWFSVNVFCFIFLLLLLFALVFLYRHYDHLFYKSYKLSCWILVFVITITKKKYFYLKETTDTIWWLRVWHWKIMLFVYVEAGIWYRKWYNVCKITFVGYQMWWLWLMHDCYEWLFILCFSYKKT